MSRSQRTSCQDNDKRLKRRQGALQLHDLPAYRAYLDTHPEEWRILDGMCRISVSRFYRHPDAFETLQADVLPRLAKRPTRVNTVPGLPSAHRLIVAYVLVTIESMTL